MSGFSQASPVLASSSHFTYRPDVDGLRAIAILAVLIFHAFPDWLPSGFIGVDIFFVISGFLITSIIQQDIQTASFRLSDFYSRRIRRIFPALILVMFCTLLAGWQSLLASEYKQLGKHVAFGAGFSANIVYWLESGYFDVSAQLKPLLHLWSLGVEEQFYVFWPLLLLGAAKLRMRPWIPVVLVLAISFFLNIYLVKSAATQTFFMLHTRAWQLAAGAFIAVLGANQGYRFSFAAISRIVSRTGIKPGNFCAFSGLALLVAGFVVIRNEQNFPGWYAIMPTLGCALLIAGGAENMLAKYLLSNRLLVALGLISFPLYLWHWPLLSFAMILEAGKPSDNLKCLMLVLALVFAYFTYAGLEKPIRRSRHAQKIVLSLLVMLSALAYLGYNIYSREGLGFRAPDFQKISASQGEWEFPGELKRTEIAGVSIFAQATNNSQTTLFVGDSNLEQYYPRIAQLIRQDSQTNSVLFLSEGGCLPIPHTKSKQNSICDGVANGVAAILDARPAIRKVVIAAQWYGYLFHESQAARFQKNDEDLAIGLRTAGYQKSLAALEAEIKMMRARGVEVYLILNIPIGIEFNPSYIANRSMASIWAGFSTRGGGLRLREFETAFADIKQDLSQLGLRAGAKLIDPTDVICHADVCGSLDPVYGPKYKDNGHLRPGYVRNAIHFLDEAVH